MRLTRAHHVRSPGASRAGGRALPASRSSWAEAVVPAHAAGRLRGFDLGEGRCVAIAAARSGCCRTLQKSAACTMLSGSFSFAI